MVKKTFIIALLIALICIFALPGTAGAAPPSHAKGLLIDPIKIDTGYISGTVIGDPDNPVHIYRGIPYAAPPVGDLRWKPPQPAESWEGIRECTDFCLAPPQDWNNPKEPYPMPIGEDCLYLNVQTPARTKSEKLPVMVWFHGGGFNSSHGNSPTFNSPPLPQHGMVLVSVTHRLGVIGLMAHPELSTESPEGVSGNYMFLDLIASLEWVQRNIAAFGGDPDNVTIAGESGGGGKCIGMLTSPLAEGLFHRCIIESGAMMTQGTPLADVEALGEELFAKLGVTTLEEARAFDWEDIIIADMELSAEKGAMMGLWGFTVDGYVFPDSPGTIIGAGEHNVVPLIVGVNLGEIIGPSELVMPIQIPMCVDLLAGNNMAGAKSYAYIFDLVPAGWRALGGGCGHSMELPYVFGVLDIPDEWDYRIGLAFGPDPPPGVTEDPGVTDADWDAADEVMRIWVQFMKTGDPSVKHLIEWPAWEASTDLYLYVAIPLEVKSGFSEVGQ